MENIDIFTFYQINHHLLAALIILAIVWLVINLMDSIFYFYHRWIKKDLSISAVKSNWKFLL